MAPALRSGDTPRWMTVGDLIGDRFLLERLAGSGGMGTVWRAHDRATGGRVAVKTVRCAGRADEVRFEREAEVLAQLDHPGIVRHIAHGALRSGALYLVMEWLDGEDLQQRQHRAPLDAAEGVALVARVAEALGSAHARGIVHRDIKPSNLLLVEGAIDRVKLLDFGVARITVAPTVTGTGAIVGTPGYMAPEQARGLREIDARADVFSLGCVLYECLTGRPPFEGENAVAVLLKIVLDEAPRLARTRDDLPPELDALLARLLDRAPNRRPANGHELARELLALSGGLTVGGMPALRSPVEPALRVLTAVEQQLVSVLLLRPPHAPAGVDAAVVATLTYEDAAGALERLESVVAGYRGRVEQLFDGSVAVTLQGRGTATDRAAQAARCALAVRSLSPDSPMVLATGRGQVGGRWPVGEVIDRAVALLERCATAERGAIRLDELTAGLLDQRFEVVGSGDGLALRGEREGAEAARMLLGRPSPFVGRNRELLALHAIFEQSVDEGMASAALITAPAGVGKSRLRQELLGRIRLHRPGAEVWIARGDPLRMGSAFALLAQALCGTAGVRDGEPLAARRQKLRARLGRHLAGERLLQATEFLGELIGAPPARPAPRDRGGGPLRPLPLRPFGGGVRRGDERGAPRLRDLVPGGLADDRARWLRAAGTAPGGDRRASPPSARGADRQRAPSCVVDGEHHAARGGNARPGGRVQGARRARRPALRRGEPVRNGLGPPGPLLLARLPRRRARARAARGGGGRRAARAVGRHALALLVRHPGRHGANRARAVCPGGSEPARPAGDDGGGGPLAGRRAAPPQPRAARAGMPQRGAAPPSARAGAVRGGAQRRFPGTHQALSRDGASVARAA
ncbi:MAG: hypothetical protein EXR72_07970 [Myxococcales bacterium]|nr:hypothetical protein [Myxococcales bacterium]